MSNTLPDARLSETAVLHMVRERIESGYYAPGIRLPAERALASEFGVSRGVVRNVYAHLTTLGLIEQSHYHRPHIPLRPVAAPPIATVVEDRPVQVQTIAAILPSDPSFPGGLSVVAGIHRVLADLDSPYRLTYVDTYHKDRPQLLRLEAQALTSAIEDKVSGIILWYFSPEEEIVEILDAHPDLPVVFIDRYPLSIDCDFAGLDDVESSKGAVEYLIESGHTRIAHLMDPGTFSTIDQRAQGYREAFAARGLAVPEDLMFHLEWSPDDAKVTNTDAAFDYLFGLDNPPTAVFTSNDYIAHRFIKVAQSRGVRVPDDVSVVGHGNTDRYAQNSFLTSVDQPFEAIGRSAAKLLLKRIGSSGRRHSFQRIILPAALVERESCRSLR